jgi:hypothetical protein
VEVGLSGKASRIAGNAMKTRTPSSPALIVAVLLLGPGCSQGSTDNPSAWVGHAYLATPADPYTYLTKPRNPSVKELLAKFIPNFLLKVNGASGDEVSLTIAPAKKQTDPPEQDLCNVTVEASAKVSAYPNIQIGPMDLPLVITATPEGEPAMTAKANIRGFALSDVLPKGSTVSESGKLTALVDSREIYTLVTALQGQSAEEMCKLMKSTFNNECVPCPDSQLLCILLEADEFGADEAAIDVKTVAESDRDPSCPKP